MSLGNKEVFAKNLKRYIGLSQKSRLEICEALGFKYTTFTDWCNGKKYPRIDSIEKLANFFNVKKSALIEDSSSFNDSVNNMSGFKQVTGFIKVFDGIPCGNPRYIDDEVVDYMPTFRTNPSDYYAVIVHGDSMVDAGIESGDRVTFRIQNTAENGDIVACRINGEECTLKRFRQDGNMVYLMPANKEYLPIIVPATDFESGDAQIMGVAVEVSKKL